MREEHTQEAAHWQKRSLRSKSGEAVLTAEVTLGFVTAVIQI